MEIYTSYFARLRKIEERGIIPVAICQYPPKFYNGAMAKEVAPDYEMIQGMKDERMRDFFRIKYEDFLQGVDKKAFIRHLEIIGGGKDVALLCFEKPIDFCHRHVVAAWLGLNPAEAEMKF